jgi:hypothetical protein
MYKEVLKELFVISFLLNIYTTHFNKKYIKYIINTNIKGLNKKAFLKLKLSK